jgi:MFS superfamily sulfate permease-like transporter
MTLRTRRSSVFLAVGLVLFAAFVPGAAANLPVAILAPLWLILPTVAITLIRRLASRCDDQPTSLLALVASRAPPSTLAFG